MSNLQLGSVGPAVSTLQNNLNEIDDAVLTVDGRFGQHTQTAVIAFQSSKGLTTDGVVGPLTQAAITACLLAGSTPPTPPVKPPPINTSNILHGIDIYHGDDVNSWPEIVAAGYTFAYIKASDGTSADPHFVASFTNGKANGVICGAYHFFEPGVSPVAQAQAFSKIILSAAYSKTDMPPTLDWEYADGHDPSRVDIANAQIFLETVHSLTGREPIIYMSEYMPAAILSTGATWIQNYSWWIAEYGVSTPKISNWIIWQKYYTASIPGLNEGSDASDANIYMGTLDEFKAWILTT